MHRPGRLGKGTFGAVIPPGMTAQMRLLVLLGLAGGAHAPCTDFLAGTAASTTNHFHIEPADCTSPLGCGCAEVTAADSTEAACVIVVDAGYGGGSLICASGVVGNYVAIAAIACIAGEYSTSTAYVCSACILSGAVLFK